MKNLKKVLSLALALIMVCGLMMSASAVQDVTELEDWGDVQNKDAVSLLNAFEIMQGDANGFRPDDNVTRAEAIKMIAVALWGGVDDGSLYNTGNVGNFDDVDAGFWARGHINFGVVKEIIAGKGNNKFDPRGNVTGYELLKMCLIALGYGAEEEGLVGPGWDIRTMAIAQKIGLTIGYKGVPSQPLTRDEAALIIYNMILTNTVYYSDATGKLITSYNDDEIFGYVYLGMGITTGVAIANDTTDPFDTAPNAGFTVVASLSAWGKGVIDRGGQTPVFYDGISYFRYPTATDICGTVVRVFTKTDVRGNTTVLNIVKVDAMNAVITPNASRSNVANATYFRNFKLTDASELARMHKIDTVKYVDFNFDGRADIALITGYHAAVVNNITARKTADGVDYNSIAFGTVNYTTAALGTVSTTSFTLLGKEIARGDRVVYRDITKGTAQDAPIFYDVVEILEGVEGKVTAVAYDESYAFIDDVKKDVNLSNKANAAADYRMTPLGKEGSVYYFSDKIVMMDGKAVSRNYALVHAVDVTVSTAFAQNTATTKVLAILDDGTRATYTVLESAVEKLYNAINGNGAYKTDLGLATAGNAAPGGSFQLKVINALLNPSVTTQGNATIYTYAVDGASINLGAVDDVALTVAGRNGVDYAQNNGNMGGKLVDETTTVFAYNTTATAWYVFKGVGSIPSLEMATAGNNAVGQAVITSKYSANDKLAAVAITGSTTASEASGVYLVLSKGEWIANNAIGAPIYRYQVFNGSSVEVVNMVDGDNFIGYVYTKKVNEAGGTVKFENRIESNPKGFIIGIQDVNPNYPVMQVWYNGVTNPETITANTKFYDFNVVTKYFAIGNPYTYESVQTQLHEGHGNNAYQAIFLDTNGDMFADAVVVYSASQNYVSATNATFAFTPAPATAGTITVAESALITSFAVTDVTGCTSIDTTVKINDTAVTFGGTQVAGTCTAGDMTAVAGDVITVTVTGIDANNNYFTNTFTYTVVA